MKHQIKDDLHTNRVISKIFRAQILFKTVLSCPVCAAMIGGDPNMITDDLAGHLAVQHRTGRVTGSGGPK